MTYDKITNKVKELASDSFGIRKSEIDIDASFMDDLGDSLETVELILSVQDEFGVDIPEHEKFYCVKDISDYLYPILSKRGPIYNGKNEQKQQS